MYKQTVVFPWYREEDYGRLLCSCSDSYLFPRSYGEWNSAAQQALSEKRSQGMTIVKVYVDSNDFFGWCREKNMMPDAAARQLYAETLAQNAVVGRLIVVDTIHAVAA